MAPRTVLPDASVWQGSSLTPMRRLAGVLVPVVGACMLLDAVGGPLLLAWRYGFSPAAVWEQGLAHYTWRGSVVDLVVVGVVRFLLCSTYWSTCPLPWAAAVGWSLASLGAAFAKVCMLLLAPHHAHGPPGTEVAILALAVAAPAGLLAALANTWSGLHDDDVRLIPSLQQLYTGSEPIPDPARRGNGRSPSTDDGDNGMTERSALLGGGAGPINGDAAAPRVRKAPQHATAPARVSALTQLFSYCRPDGGLLALTLVFLLLSMGLKLAIPNFSSKCLAIIIRDGTNGQDPTADPDFQEFVVFLVLTAALFAVFSGLRIWVSAKAEVRIIARIQRILFSSLMTKDLEYFDQQGTGNLTSRLSSDCTLLGSVFTTNVNSVLQSGIILFGSLSYLFVLNPELAGIYLAVASVFFLATKKFGSFVKKLQTQIQNDKAAANGIAEQAISLISIVRSFAAEVWEKDRYDQWNKEMLFQQLRIKMAYTLYVPVIVVVQNLLLLIVLVLGAKQVGKKRMTASDLATFLFYSQNVQDSMSTLSSQIIGIMTGLGAGAKVFEIIGEAPKVCIRGGKAPRGQPGTGARLEVRNLSFTYGDSPAEGSPGAAGKDGTSKPSTQPDAVLRDVSLTVEPGQRVAIVGLSGSGKSTLVDLILGFRQPESGSILFDGDHIGELDPEAYRQTVAQVAQDPALFAVSVRDNIGYATDAATHDDVVAAAKLACADEFIRALPDGYDTILGERGATLSGGQRQRVGIARAVVRKGLRLLVLDEATSSLDTQSEAAVSQALEDLNRERGVSMITVAHRLSTVRGADLILVMSGGRIVETGTHESLLRLNGTYKALVERQLTTDRILDSDTH